MAGRGRGDRLNRTRLACSFEAGSILLSVLPQNGCAKSPLAMAPKDIPIRLAEDETPISDLLEMIFEGEA